MSRGRRQNCGARRRQVKVNHHGLFLRRFKNFGLGLILVLCMYILPGGERRNNSVRFLRDNF